jgi:hypothetical protein
MLLGFGLLAAQGLAEDWAAYGDEDRGYSFKLPWEWDFEDDDSFEFYAFLDDDGLPFKPRVSLVISEGGEDMEGIGLLDLIEDVKPGYLQSLRDSGIVEPLWVDAYVDSISGRQAYCFEIDHKRKGGTIRLYQYSFLRGTQIWIISFSLPGEDYEDYLPFRDAFLEEFRLES